MARNSQHADTIQCFSGTLSTFALLACSGARLVHLDFDHGGCPIRTGGVCHSLLSGIGRSGLLSWRKSEASLITKGRWFAIPLLDHILSRELVHKKGTGKTYMSHSNVWHPWWRTQRSFTGSLSGNDGGALGDQWVRGMGTIAGTLPNLFVGGAGCSYLMGYWLLV